VTHNRSTRTLSCAYISLLINPHTPLPPTICVFGDLRVTRSSLWWQQREFPSVRTSERLSKCIDKDTNGLSTASHGITSNYCGKDPLKTCCAKCKKRLNTRTALKRVDTGRQRSKFSDLCAFLGSVKEVFGLVRFLPSGPLFFWEVRTGSLLSFLSLFFSLPLSAEGTSLTTSLRYRTHLFCVLTFKISEFRID